MGHPSSQAHIGCSSDAVGLLGNPENRRVRQFVATAARRDVAVRVVSWADVLTDPTALDALDGCGRVRIDSAGENAEVTKRLIALGGGRETPLRHGEVGSLNAYHAGFSRVLSTLARAPLPWMTHPTSILAMFDKYESHRRFVGAGLPRPSTGLAPSNVTEFRASLPGPAGQIFLKPRYGSSASGVCAFRWAPGRQSLTAPIEIERVGDQVTLFNSLKVRTYRRGTDVDLILGRLLPEGMVCETWIPKAALDGRTFDLRIVVVAGEARQMVVRQSRHPMTNLHLGNARGDVAALTRVHGAPLVARCRALAEAATACFADALYAGVDVLVSTDLRPYLVEINAFGDLLPGVQHRGETPYESILEACNGRDSV